MLGKKKIQAASQNRGKVMKMPAGKRSGEVSKRPESGRRLAVGRLLPDAQTACEAKLPYAALRIKGGYISASRNKSLSRVTAFFFGITLIYIIQSLITFAFKPHTIIEQITSGSVMSPVDLTGVIIRDERVYRSTAAGSVRFNIAENERVKKGTVLCSIQDSDEVNRINEELIEVNEELFRIQAMCADTADLNGSGRRINLLIKNTLDDWAFRKKLNDFSSLYTLMDNLSANIELRNQTILSGSSDALSEQLYKRQLYKEELTKHMTLIASEESGVFSSLLDNYEETYTPNIMAKLSKGQTILKNNHDKPVSLKTVEPETPLFKVIHSNIWYIATYISNDIIEGWKENDAKIIHVNTYSDLPVTVERIVAQDSESYVLFKCTRYLEEYLHLRQLHFRVSGDINEGLKIPQSAVAMKTLIIIPRDYATIEDAQIKRATLVKSGSEKLTLNYTAIDDDYVYMDPDNNSSLLGIEILNPSDEQSTFQLIETAEVMGVYRVNNGIADFRKVIIGDIPQSLGYYILEPGLNKGLQEKDSIVYNAAEVKDGQIIF